MVVRWSRSPSEARWDVAEFMTVDGVQYPRHPEFPIGELSEPTRLRQMLMSVEFARKHCTTRERPLYTSLCRIEQTIRRSLGQVNATPPDLGTPMIWEDEPVRLC